MIAAAVAKGSFFDGSDGLGTQDTQANSATSEENFINFCSGKTLTNGLQNTDGSCNGIPMGNIPAKSAMISSILLNPQAGDTITAGTDFDVQVQTSNLVAGSFTNADTTYYSAPQDLQDGKVIGHTHITVQDLGDSLNPTTPPDPTQFAFFKGINDAGDGNGLLSAIVSGGLPAGNYRVCTMNSAANHQPVIMPVAQRGSQDDCNKFTVEGDGGETNAAANNGADGEAAANTAAEAVNDGPGAIVDDNGNASNSSSTISSSSFDDGQDQQQQEEDKNKNSRNKRRNLRFGERIFVA
ncbi:uncharacterized protein BCR38DRAFT_151046 [Pseudomassariella vexata]|uniref:Ribosomal protein s17 n=1 Tax=Pseudomassariella vexata TaxID=1141098 RepID=A0A1Y2E6E4_9PEZI|nr:uncharacterized protein BCR38DRAFT_151046 [Pseudomassariella vexata]ORY67079.1 hypothetical protein BCR38DRAFT_151046 [Pseudomassariella vexata]